MIYGKVIYDVPPRLLARQANEATKYGVERAVAFWHRFMMPGHFTVAGGKKYGYQPRSGDAEPPRLVVERIREDGTRYRTTRSNPHYSWRKRRRFRHNKPLVWSGRSAAMARSGVRVSSRNVRAEGSIRGTATMNVPGYFYQYLKAGTYTKRLFDGTTHFTIRRDQPKKYEELVRTTPDEVRVLAEVTSRNAQRHLARQGVATPSAIRRQAVTVRAA